MINGVIKMIKKLDSNDIDQLLAFAYASPDINLFLIGDLENIGLEADCVDIWGYYEDNILGSVLLRYYDAFTIYEDKKCGPVDEFCQIINEANVQMVNGETEIIGRYAEKFFYKQKEDTVLCAMRDKAILPDVDVSDIKIAKPEDSRKICALLGTIKEFGEFSEEEIETKIKTRAGRVYFIENVNGEIISVAQTAAENSRSAMLVGVCTHLEYRRRGLMKQVVVKLCNDLINENKRLCLFYSNPVAGSVYLKLGFEPIGEWTMLKF